MNVTVNGCSGDIYVNGWCDITFSWQTLTVVVILYRKLWPWWVRNSQYLNPHTPLAKLCTWRLRWHHLEHLARHPNQVLSQTRRSGWGRWHRILGKETNMSMGKGESGQAGTTREHIFPDYVTLNVSVLGVSRKLLHIVTLPLVMCFVFN